MQCPGHHVYTFENCTATCIHWTSAKDQRAIVLGIRRSGTNRHILVDIPEVLKQPYAHATVLLLFSVVQCMP